MKAIHVSGRRKTSIAKATLTDGKGIIRINSQLLDVYNPILSRERIKEPLILAGDLSKKVNINIKVAGGGFQSQAEAIRLAIARTLLKKNPSLKETFLKYDRHLLIADTRRKEQYKPNDSKARAMRQSSKR